ncbi:MAG: hypothetical protein ACLGH8_08270 [Bacteroidia bacterium]
MALVFFMLVFLAIAVVGGFLYLLYLPVKIWMLKTGRLTRPTSRLINKIYIAVLCLAILGISYSGVFPDESFYADEFKDVTLRELPESAEFVSKWSEYPDFHGEYASQSEIKLSKADFTKLLMELQNDKRLTKAEERVSIMGGLENGNGITYQFTREDANLRGRYLYIGFDVSSYIIYVDVGQF